jgi:hypothetical protein
MKHRIYYYTRKKKTIKEIEKSGGLDWPLFSFKTSKRQPIDLANLSDNQLEIDWNFKEKILPNVREYQRSIFSVIKNYFINQQINNRIEYISLDIPLRYSDNGFQLTRYIDFVDEKDPRFILINKEKNYNGEPFYPRLGIKKNNVIIEKEIDGVDRDSILKLYLKKEGNTSKSLFKPRCSEILKLYFEEPTIKPHQLRKKLGISQYTIANHRKDIGDKVKELFGITLPDYGRSAALYLHEMGFPIPKVI